MEQKLTKVLAVQTDDGDWYVIPEEMNYFWERLINQMIEENYENQETIDLFERHFGKYATGGCLSLIDLYSYL